MGLVWLILKPKSGMKSKMNSKILRISSVASAAKAGTMYDKTVLCNKAMEFKGLALQAERQAKHRARTLKKAEAELGEHPADAGDPQLQADAGCRRPPKLLKFVFGAAVLEPGPVVLGAAVKLQPTAVKLEPTAKPERKFKGGVVKLEPEQGLKGIASDPTAKYLIVVTGVCEINAHRSPANS